MLIDILFAILFLIACFKGYQKGLIVALFSMIGFIIGLAAAIKLSTIVAVRLASNSNVSAKWLPVISFMLIFLIVVLLVNICAGLLQKTAEWIKLGWLNRLGGIVLFVLLYCLVFSVFLFFAVQLQLLKSEATESSICYSIIKPLGPGVIDRLGIIIPFFKDMFTGLEHFFGTVANKL
jgi:membrane protein required for colicin V production